MHNLRLDHTVDLTPHNLRGDHTVVGRTNPLVCQFGVGVQNLGVNPLDLLLLGSEDGLPLILL